MILIAASWDFPTELGDIPQMYLHEKKMAALVVISPLKAKKNYTYVNANTLEGCFRAL